MAPKCKTNNIIKSDRESQHFQFKDYAVVVCALGAGLGTVICSEIYFYIAYIMPTSLNLVRSGPTLQLEDYEEIVCAPSGRWVGKCTFY